MRTPWCASPVEVHPEAPIDPHDGEARGRQVTWADGLVRMAAAATDALDADLRRTGNPGDRHQVVVHCDIDPEGRLGPGQLEFGPVVSHALTRYLACDARVLVAAHQAGRLVGLQPTDRRPNRATRRYLARRDQGCRHPLCHQRRWLHAHHIVFWDDGGLTVPENLVLLCPRHHRALHQGEFSIEGDPEAGTLRFRDRFGRQLTPPPTGPPTRPDLRPATSRTRPLARPHLELSQRTASHHTRPSPSTKRGRRARSPGTSARRVTGASRRSPAAP